MSGTNNSEQPGLVAGHVQYAKGAAETVIGDVTGSEAWKTSGQQDKAAGLSTMQQAEDKRDGATQGYGRMEELAGKAVGCDGMKKEGAASKNDKTE
ncbi:hypothetical protein CDD81_3481 [Ophiocordyceps australis]|uniref:CsbD-like domain-containing protein n=1 Tax=Ophiocordyceps australis TaxID=1399860 RepID=A0A2C5YBT6_9HYPO|nr:hypothetical protein CDD81_3481 [Ophiocordyceps australis]